MAAFVPLNEIVYKTGNPVRVAEGVSVYVYTRGTSTQAALFSDEAGDSALTQPLVTDDTGLPVGPNGERAWIASGNYTLTAGFSSIPFTAPLPEQGPPIIGTEQVEATNIKNGSVTAPKLGSEAVETPNIKAGAVTTAKLGAEAVETSNIKAGAVTLTRVAAGAVAEAQLGSEAVATAKIKGAAVTSAKIANEAVTTEKLTTQRRHHGEDHQCQRHRRKARQQCRECRQDRSRSSHGRKDRHERSYVGEDRQRSRHQGRTLLGCAGKPYGSYAHPNRLLNRRRSQSRKLRRCLHPASG